VIEDEIALVSVLTSVARRRLLKTENPCACNGELEIVQINDSVYLSKIKRTCNRSANKSNHPN
jgi:hypothetical protein